MRILIYSRAFLPKIGGLELTVDQLARQFLGRGHEVVVITTTQGDDKGTLPYQVLRNPGPLEFLHWVHWCDVFHHPNVSLQGFWPLLLIRRPWVVVHHSWYCRADGRIAWQDRLKRYLLRFAAGSIAVSRAVADDLATKSVVVGNAYRDRMFRVLPDVDRSLEMVFLGRLVSDKGVDTLLEALGILAGEGQTPRLTVIGEGPERMALEAQARRLQIEGQVSFVGAKIGDELVRLLNQHRILVVPSRYNEPFGIVALEGIACGCVVVGSRGGGLKDAIGTCGRTFPNGDAAALATLLGRLLKYPAELAECLSGAPGQLAVHTAEHVMERYLEVFEGAARRGWRN